MKSRQQKILFLLITVILLLGIFFRFANLDSKVYWGDETVTSLRISGYNLQELQTFANSDRPLSIQDLQKYQYPNSEKGFIDTINGLAIEEPQHPPLYFVMVKQWVQWFGNSVTITRSFSALISLLTFPLIYLVCQELFSFSVISWVAVALLAVSPFHILYAQEARSYSLWTVTILLSSWALLRAIRLKTNLSWGIYAVTIAIGFYTFIFSAVVTLVHSIYIVIHEKFKLTKTVKSYLLALITGVILFIPWIVAVLTNFTEADQTTSWTKKTLPITYLAKTWILNLSRVFIDFNYNFVTRNLFWYLTFIALLLLTVYAIYYLYQETKPQAWLFVLLLMAIASLPLVLLDLTSGGIRSTVARYFIPSYLAIEITVAYLLATKMTSRYISNWQRQTWRIAFLTIVLSGIISCSRMSSAQVWWNKYNAIHIPKVAQIVNQSNNPTVITTWHYLMIFSHILDETAQLAVVNLNLASNLLNSTSENSLNNNPQDIYIHNSSKAIETLVQSNSNYRVETKYQWKHKIEPVYETKTVLWKLSK